MFSLEKVTAAIQNLFFCTVCTTAKYVKLVNKNRNYELSIILFNSQASKIFKNN